MNLNFRERICSVLNFSYKMYLRIPIITLLFHYTLMYYIRNLDIKYAILYIVCMNILVMISTFVQFISSVKIYVNETMIELFMIIMMLVSDAYLFTSIGLFLTDGKPFQDISDKDLGNSFAKLSLFGIFINLLLTKLDIYFHGYIHIYEYKRNQVRIHPEEIVSSSSITRSSNIEDINIERYQNVEYMTDHVDPRDLVDMNA